MEVEVWKDVVGFEAHYEVSNLGQVKRKKGLTHYIDGRIARFSETILKPTIDKKGYEKVYLSVGSKKHSKRVHRIVAIAFIPNSENKAHVNHIDCDKRNNSVQNLEWMTNTENMRHAFRSGIYKERDKTTIYNIKHMHDKLCLRSGTTK